MVEAVEREVEIKYRVKVFQKMDCNMRASEHIPKLVYKQLVPTVVNGTACLHACLIFCFLSLLLDFLMDSIFSVCGAWNLYNYVLL